jgi:YidC/Oxa1 family membrane protein insertase
MELNKRSLWLAAIFLTVGLVYLGVTEFFGGDATEETAVVEEGSGTPEDDGEGTPPAADPAEREALKQTKTITGEGFVAIVDNLGGGIRELRLTDDPRFTTEDGEPANMRVETPREQFAALRTHFERLGVPDDAVWELEQVSPSEVRLTWEGEGLRIVRTLSAGEGPYQIWQDIELTNTGERARRTQLGVSVYHYVRHSEESGGFLGFGSRSPKISNGACAFGDETERVNRDDLAPKEEPSVPHGYGNGDVHFAAVEDVYFVQAVAAAEGAPAQRCRLWGTNLPNNVNDIQGTLFEARLVYPWQTVEPGASLHWRNLGYLGPKIPAALETAGHQLPEVVDLGFFALIASQLARLLGFIHQYVPNWGLAIILLTFLIRLVLFPLTNLSFKSMARMRRLKPDMDRINEIYKDQAEKKGAAIMELYRRQKINPLAGCLPMVLQLPVWWALYTSLSTNIELYHMPFTAWWTDLSSPDQFFVLPLALGALMHVQQRLTPTTMDPAQAKMMMWFMPIMITVFMLFLPSGLCLYMLTNSALGIGQQKLNEWRLSKEPAPQAAAAMTPEGDETDGGDDDSSSSNEPNRPKRKRIRRTRRG